MIEANINPIIEYGAEVWGKHKADNINQVILRSLRFFLGVHRYTPIIAILGDTGWIIPEVRREVGCKMGVMLS